MVRVCTSAECRYMLCGITVAPSMVMARYRLWLLRRGSRPVKISLAAGRAHSSSTQKQRVGGGEQDSHQQGNVEKQVERDGGAQHFGQVAGGNRDLAKHPEDHADLARVGLPAGLRQVAPAND